ncbi:MAG: isomerizing glutamine--fructose-6-phosphate transaminase [Holosporales bacterium]|jgi:glucosamine--fructose-6-phosphate aminotransferase (isomerizing)|nr:isomerizing glutamine--fructose-6-phosphate transaminase [Holosporales bacterium]
MCGLVGIASEKGKVSLVLDVLSKLEYRGYDSAGYSLVLPSGELCTRKVIGSVSGLSPLPHCDSGFSGASIAPIFVGIAHTRWATHGDVSIENAQPQTNETIAVAHNGIIENYAELKEIEFANEKNVLFRSQTDTEIIVHLIAKYFASKPDKTLESFVEATQYALARLNGTFALAIINSLFKDVIIVAKKDSPLVVGTGVNEFSGDVFFASDVVAIAQYVGSYTALDDGDLCLISRKQNAENPDASLGFHCEFLKFKINQANTASNPTDSTSKEKDVQSSPNKTDCDAVCKKWEKSLPSDPLYGKGDFQDFTSKEIFDQQKVVSKMINTLERGDFVPLARRVSLTKSVNFLACGSSLYAGVIGRYILEKYCGMPASAECASEFSYRNAILSPDGLYVFISQSGETGDTLRALDYTMDVLKRHAILTGAFVEAEAEAKGHSLASLLQNHILVVTNSVHSSIARRVNNFIPLNAGPEFGVVSTKAFSAQVAVLACLAVELLQQRAKHGPSELAYIKSSVLQLEQDFAPTGLKLYEDLKKVPDLLKETLQFFDAFDSQKEMFKIVKTLAGAKSVLFLGRGVNYPVASESALKFKEITYIHAEGYPAGEMKHGPIALVDESVVSVFIMPSDELMPKTLSNIQEIVARRGTVILLTDRNGKECVNELARQKETKILTCVLPETGDFSKLFVYSVMGQIIAYKVARLMGLNVDRPRNLAKSVTVE